MRVSIRLFGLTSASKAKNVCQPMNRRGARLPPVRSSGSGWAELGRVEGHREEWSAGVSGEVRAVRRAHHAVTEAVRRTLELDRDERVAVREVEPAACGQDRVDPALANEEWQELVEDQPVVVPRQQPPGAGEYLVGVGVPLAAHLVDGVVVEEQERRVQAGDDQVLVVSRITDDRGVVRRPRQILEQAAALDPELDRVGRVVEMWADSRPPAVDRVEVE
jgi:hypothetical protein